MRKKRVELEQAVIRQAREFVVAWHSSDDDALDAIYRLERVVVELDNYDAAEIVASRGSVGHNAPQTSQDAASLAVLVQGHVRRLVVDEVAAAQYGVQRGLTCQELEQHLKRPHTTVSSAINWLSQSEAGWLEDSGLRRPTPSGREAIVWRLTPAGLRKRRE